MLSRIAWGCTQNIEEASGFRLTVVETLMQDAAWNIQLCRLHHLFDRCHWWNKRLGFWSSVCVHTCADKLQIARCRAFGESTSITSFSDMVERVMHNEIALYQSFTPPSLSSRIVTHPRLRKRCHILFCSRVSLPHWVGYWLNDRWWPQVAISSCRTSGADVYVVTKLWERWWPWWLNENVQKMLSVGSWILFCCSNSASCTIVLPTIRVERALHTASNTYVNAYTHD